MLQDPVNFIDPYGEDAANAFFAGMMDGVSFGGFSYLMGSMGMMNRVDDPCAYELGAKAVDFVDNFNPRGWLKKGWKETAVHASRVGRGGKQKKLRSLLSDMDDIESR